MLFLLFVQSLLQLVTSPAAKHILNAFQLVSMRFSEQHPSTRCWQQ